MERAASHRALKQYDEALTDLAEALKENPRHIRALLLRGYVHDEKQERELAFADYQKVLQLDPNSGRPGITRPSIRRMRRRTTPPRAKASAKRSAAGRRT